MAGAGCIFIQGRLVINQELPFVTGEGPGLTGSIKNEPGHFVVEEIPLYEPSGQGDHLYVRLTREGWNTRDVLRRLSDIFGLREVDVGYAGLKDKQARVTQTFSLGLRGLAEEEAAARLAGESPFEVVQVKRHQNKLKTGHLLGNSFTILMAGGREGDLDLARETAEKLLSRGLANYYGVQRFGADGDNADRGREALLGRGPRQNWLRRFLLSAYQSHLFNLWLARRIGRGWFERLLPGDVAKKTDTGGIFEIEDAEVEGPRFEARQITYTGPIYGAKMRWAGGDPGQLEREILAEAEVTEDLLKRARLDGSRRPGRLFLSYLDIQAHGQGLMFKFSLPKGSYATTVLREFTKSDPGLNEAAEQD